MARGTTGNGSGPVAFMRRRAKSESRRQQRRVGAVISFLWVAAGFAVMAIAMLGLGSRPMPREIATFQRATQAERSHDRRSALLTRTGYVSLGCAAAAVVLAVIIGKG